MQPGPIYARPIQNCTNDNEACSFHPGGANMLMAAAAVHFVREPIEVAIFAALTTKASGEPLDAGW